MWYKKKYLVTVVVVLFISLSTLAFTNSDRSTAGVSVEHDDGPPAADLEVEVDDDPWNEIRRIVENYYSKDGIMYKGKMTLVDESLEKERVLEETEFEYTLFDNSYYCRLGSLEMAVNNDLVLAADQNTRTVSLSHQMHNSGNNPASFFDLEQFKKLLNEKEATASITRLNEQKIITIDNIQDPAIQGYRIFYDPATYRISKMEIGMVRFSSIDEENKEGGMAEEHAISPDKSVEAESQAFTYFLQVNFTEIQPLSLTKKDFHPENKFIRNKGKIVVLTPAYKDYTLIGAGE